MNNFNRNFKTFNEEHNTFQKFLNSEMMAFKKARNAMEKSPSKRKTKKARTKSPSKTNTKSPSKTNTKSHSKTNTKSHSKRKTKKTNTNSPSKTNELNDFNFNANQFNSGFDPKLVIKNDLPQP